MKKSFYIAAGMAVLTACSPKAQNVSSNGTNDGNSNEDPVSVVVAEPMPGMDMNSRPVLARLKATVFKMSGDYANNVAVTLGPDGELRYFPAPSDITANSRPEEIGDGWWLNRQGISANSVFTRYTFEEYSNLKTVPSPDEIKAAIIPGARVIEFRQLAIPAEEARKMSPTDLLQMIQK